MTPFFRTYMVPVPRKELASPAKLTFPKFVLAGFLLHALPAGAQTPATPPANYDETLVGSHLLPDPLHMQNGEPVGSTDAWMHKRRPEILRLFQEHVYGRTPSSWGKIRIETLSETQSTLGGKARRKTLRISLEEHPEWRGIEVLLYTPASATGPVPCFVGLNFRGNHAVTHEADVPISEGWLRFAKVVPPRPGEPTLPEQTRGREHSRWIPETLISSGYALATAFYGDIEPDHPTGWQEGVRAALSPAGKTTEWKAGDWGAIGAWAWGLSRILDALEKEPSVDASRCAVVGHSRLGKTALWAGASDTRFSIVLSNNSGEGGAALMRRNFGETVATITLRFPHWFAGRFGSYANNEAQCPVDQHLLVALAAPRPVAIGSAQEDRWADPKGEFLSGKHAGTVYALFGKQGIAQDEPPAVGKSVGDTVQYHLRAGAHDITKDDWAEYLKFCSRHWGR